jgi:hypothetical protein
MYTLAVPLPPQFNCNLYHPLVDNDVKLSSGLSVILIIFTILHITPEPDHFQLHKPLQIPIWVPSNLILNLLAVFSIGLDIISFGSTVNHE